MQTVFYAVNLCIYISSPHEHTSLSLALPSTSTHRKHIKGKKYIFEVSVMWRFYTQCMLA